MSRMTVVYECDARSFAGNPFKVETPFGKPMGVAADDLFEEVLRIETEFEALIERCARIAEDHGRSWPGDNLACVARRSEATAIAEAIRSLHTHSEMAGSHED